jgi:hypothetical protein
MCRNIKTLQNFKPPANIQSRCRKNGGFVPTAVRNTVR